MRLHAKDIEFSIPVPLKGSGIHYYCIEALG